MSKTNPLILSALQLWAYGPDSEVANEYPATGLFDMRHDFHISLTQSGMAVLLTFLNGRSLYSKISSGVRRPVSVSVIDVTADSVMCTAVIRINIPRDRHTGVFRADLPFAYADIDTCHSYKVEVHDVPSGQFLGESVFHTFDSLVMGNEPHCWYAAYKGCVLPRFGYDMYRSVNSEHMEFVNVCFNFVSHFKNEPDVVPEVEIRVYFPDGNIKSRFIRPECDDYDMNEYHATMPVQISSANRGVCYAELLCMDYAIAGFVFGTDGPVEPGYWEGCGLDCLDEYSLDECADRFRKYISSDIVNVDKTMKSGNDGSEYEDRELGEDDFERALNEFIASGNENINVDEGEDANCEEDETLTADKDNIYDMSDITTHGKGNSFLSPLDHLTGLKSVKDKLTVYEKVVRFNKMRRDKGLPVSSVPLHAMFLGSPGTGKTTVARMMGLMLAKAGMLSKGHVVVKERATLLGPNYSMEETNTLKAIEEAQGGILLIDEAYQLYQPDDSRDPGKFVIETLMTALSDESQRDWMLILAGYPDEMKRMFEMNPGLKSRIPDSNIYLFEDFTESELMEIAERYLQRYQYSLSHEARIALSERLAADFLQRDKTFGNARHVVNLIQTDIIPAMAVRVVSSDITESISLSEIQACDIPQPIELVHANRRRIGFCA